MIFYSITLKASDIHLYLRPRSGEELRMRTLGQPATQEQSERPSLLPLTRRRTPKCPSNCRLTPLTDRRPLVFSVLPCGMFPRKGGVCFCAPTRSSLLYLAKLRLPPQRPLP